MSFFEFIAVLVIILVIIKFIGWINSNSVSLPRQKYKNTPTDFGSNLGTTCITKNNEQVRSVSEKIIADYLYSRGINYEYERPIMNGDKIVMLPDFYLTKSKIYLEFWGEIDDAYKTKRREKQYLYKTMKLPVIQIYPQNIWRDSGTGKKYPDIKLLDYIFKKEMSNISK